MRATGCAIFLLFLVCSVLGQQCFGSFPASENMGMESCCWYEQDTCCSASTGFDVKVTNAINMLYDNITRSGEQTSPELEQCFVYYENIMCSICSPEQDFFQVIVQEGLPTLEICQSFCNSWYNACFQLPQLEVRFEGFNITSGSDLCNNIPPMSVAYQNSVVSDGSVHSPLIAVNITDSDTCFNGVPQSTILEAACSPWDAIDEPSESSIDYEMTSEEQSGSIQVEEESSQTDLGEGEESLGLEWLFLVAVIGVILIIAIVFFVVLFFFWKKKQAMAITDAANAYPDLDELEDYE